MPMYRKVIIAIMIIITMAHIAFLCGFLFLCTPVCSLLTFLTC